MAQPVGTNQMRDAYDKINAQWRGLGLLLLEKIPNSASQFKC